MAGLTITDVLLVHLPCHRVRNKNLSDIGELAPALRQSNGPYDPAARAAAGH